MGGDSIGGINGNTYQQHDDGSSMDMAYGAGGHLQMNGQQRQKAYSGGVNGGLEAGQTFDEQHYSQRQGMMGGNDGQYTNQELDYDQQTYDNSENMPLEFRDEYRFKNGAIYKGQWRGAARHGRGVQVWPDGARYEGEW